MWKKLGIFLTILKIFINQDNIEPLSTDQIRQEFNNIDTNQDGFLCAGDFRRAMPGITEEQVTQVFDYYDKDRDGVINFEEYLELTVNTQKQNEINRQATNAEFQLNFSTRIFYLIYSLF